MATGLLCFWHWKGGADAVSPLAAGGDGRANAGFGAAACGGRGQGRVFTMLAVVVYVFGIDFGGERGSDWLVWLASFTILASSFVAISKDDLKARLAYSTISQLSYIVLGAAIATSIAAQGAAIHIVMHAAGKITLFFCAGAIYVGAHLTKISELDGQDARCR